MNLIFIGKKHFHKNPLYFRNLTDFEADNETDISNIGNETANTFRQNPFFFMVII